MTTNKERLYIYDTTLRDGAQTPGIDFTLAEKQLISQMLDELGVDYIEAGYPGANPIDTEYFDSPPKLSAGLSAFGMTKRSGRSVENDPGIQGLLTSKSDAICFVAKSWDFHVDLALGISLEENLICLEQSVKAALKAGKKAMIDCEHFFDGYKANPTYALSCVETASNAGAEWVILCDTNGGTLPFEVKEIISTVKQKLPHVNLGIHAHNDTGNAVANSLSAVEAGARQIQGTINGIGERCGNANLISLLPTLILKSPYRDILEIGIKQENLSNLKQFSHKFDEIVNRAPEKQSPYVGDSAFATKAGIHASAILKNPQTYEHIAPEIVGNMRQLKVSNQAGKSNIYAALEKLSIDKEAVSHCIDQILAVVKDNEAQGFAYEAADASFQILVLKQAGLLPEFFQSQSYKVAVERRFNAMDELITVSEAIVKIKVKDKIYMSVAEGNGPVNALDQALRKDLGEYSDYLKDLELIDFKVRILNGGTAAITRVLIDSRDKDGHIWTTVGVSENIVDASYQALQDSIVYKLIKAGA